MYIVSHVRKSLVDYYNSTTCAVSLMALCLQKIFGVEFVARLKTLRMNSLGAKDITAI